MGRIGSSRDRGSAAGGAEPGGGPHVGGGGDRQAGSEQAGRVEIGPTPATRRRSPRSWPWLLARAASFESDTSGRPAIHLNESGFIKHSRDPSRHGALQTPLRYPSSVVGSAFVS
jgi:hypothetical protein